MTDCTGVMEWVRGAEPAWAKSRDEVVARLRVDPDSGLSAAEASARLRMVGPNDLPREPPRTVARSVLAQLRETMILVLLGAAILTAITGDLGDCAVIVLVVLVNTTVGVLQERRAINAVTALRSLTTPVCTVVRDGIAARVDTPRLVPGDLLLISEGDVVGADARLLEARQLQVDEGVLTGESQPVDKDATAECPVSTPVVDRTTMLHAGTLVLHGSGRAVVVGTGARTELGGIASLLEEYTAPTTPLQRRLASLGRRLSVAAVVGCAVVVLLGLLRGEPWELMIIAGISLAVAAIPESLPAVVALALAAATRRMAARGAIVRTLPSVEALGSVTVLASDKTGTLTTGRSVCVAAWTPAGGETSLAGTERPTRSEECAELLWLLRAAALCSDAEPGAAGTEGALVNAAEAAGIDVRAERRRHPRGLVIPFDSVRRRMVTRHTIDGAEVEIVKGAPEVVLPSAVPADLADVLRAWTSTGYRVLAVAAGPPRAPRTLGLLAMADPIRPEARDAILAARAAGIRTIMITGDHPGTAEAVARETGIVAATDPPLDLSAPLRPIYPRTDPGGKLAIVSAWQRAGHLVAMTGDGVNDAPALRAADVGVAMGRRGTEVAKEAADIVLTDDSLATIVHAIGEGRRVLDNVRRFVRYGLSGGLAELLVMLVGPFIGLPLPLLPAQILWVNLVTHGLPGVAIGSEAAEPDVLRRPPRPPREGIITRRTAVEVIVMGCLIAGGCLALALWALVRDRPWQSLLFATLALAQLALALTTRSDRAPFWRVSPSGNPFLFVAIAASLAATAGALYLPVVARLLGTEPLSGLEVAVSVVVAVLPALGLELFELASVRRRSRAHRAI